MKKAKKFVNLWSEFLLGQSNWNPKGAENSFENQSTKLKLMRIV